MERPFSTAYDVSTSGCACSDGLDQPRDVALDELVLEREGRGRDHDAAVVEQRRHEVGERLAGAGAGLDDEVAPLAERVADRLGHRDLARPLLAAQRLHRGREHLADRGSHRVGGRGHRCTLSAPADSARACGWVGRPGGSGGVVRRFGLPGFHHVHMVNLWCRTQAQSSPPPPSPGSQ